MNNIVSLDTDNYAAMAQAMGMAVDVTKSKTSGLARLKIQHTPTMGEKMVDGKAMKVEVISGGKYKLDVPDGPNYFAGRVTVRPFVQRFMYKRFHTGSAPDGVKGKYQKTIMAENLNIDLKDNFGDFNCGKPAGYIEDFNSLPDSTKDIIRQVKRVRVMFGLITMHDATDETGESVSVNDVPFIWEIDNRDAFKIVGQPIERLAKLKRLPIQHFISMGTEEKKIPTGAVFYVPVTDMDVAKSISIVEKDQDIFADFMAWIQNYNDYINSEWESMAKEPSLPDEDIEVVDNFIDIEDGETQ